MFTFMSVVVFILSIILTAIIFKVFFANTVFFSFAAMAKYAIVTWVVVFLLLTFIFNKIGLIKSDSSEKEEAVQTTVTQTPRYSLGEEDDNEYSYQDEDKSGEESYEEDSEEVDLSDLSEEDFYKSTDSDETEEDDSDIDDYVEDSFLIPDSDTRYLDKSDLEQFSKEECRLARNEIYARHGRMFNDKALQDYFNEQSWYEGTVSPEDFDEGVLNSREKANAKLILKYEAKLK